MKSAILLLIFVSSVSCQKIRRCQSASNLTMGEYFDFGCKIFMKKGIETIWIYHDDDLIFTFEEFENQNVYESLNFYMDFKCLAEKDLGNYTVLLRTKNEKWFFRTFEMNSNELSRTECGQNETRVDAFVVSSLISTVHSRNVTMVCKGPLRSIWRNQNYSLIQTDDKYTLLDNGDLRIQNVIYGDSIHFTCRKGDVIFDSFITINVS